MYIFLTLNVILKYNNRYTYDICSDRRGSGAQAGLVYLSSRRNLFFHPWPQHPSCHRDGLVLGESLRQLQMATMEKFLYTFVRIISVRIRYMGLSVRYNKLL